MIANSDRISSWEIDLKSQPKIFSSFELNCTNFPISHIEGVR